MTVDREQELQNTIIRQGNEIESLKAQVRGLRRDLDHATGDVVSKMSADVSRCRRILDGLNSKMRLVDEDDDETKKGGAHGRAKDRGSR